jgi:hypothetical protein
VAVDRRGNVFVADPGLGGVVKFDRLGRCESSISLVVRPLRIAIDQEGFLYVHAPTPQGFVHKCTSQGEMLFSFGRRPDAQRTPQARSSRTPGTSEYPDYLNDIGSLEMGSRDHLYFAPVGIYEVQQFSRDGRHMASVRRRIQEKPVTVLVNGRRDVAWTAVILDIATSSKGNYLYILRARLRDGHSLVDVWSKAHKYNKGLLFDHPANSITCDRYGNVYLLHSNMSQRSASLLKYRPAP